MPDNSHELRGRLQEAESNLEALRNGQVDAVVGRGGVSLVRLREVEQRLRQAEEKLALAARGTRIGIFDRDIASGEILATEQNVLLLGLRPTTTTTTTTTTLSQSYHYRDWARRVHPEDLPRVEAEMDACKRERRTFESEYRVVWPDKSLHWIAARGIFQYDGGGGGCRLLGILMDITDRKQAEEALEEANRELESRVAERTAEVRLLASRLADAQDEERQRIAAGLHDEVCQLVSAGQLKLAEARDCEDKRERDGLLDEAHRLLTEAGDEIRGLTFELSSSAPFEAGFVTAARELCAYMTEQHGVRFEVDCTRHDIAVPEPLRPPLYHCLRELLYNVVKHAGVDEATVRIEDAGDRLRISVSDCGKGVGAAHLDRPLTRQGGFGLHHVRERMRDIGGILQIESAPGEGTTTVIEVGTSHSA